MKDYVHITAGDSAKYSLNSSFELRNILIPELISLNDDLRVGPLAGINTETGYQNRREWWNTIGESGEESEYEYINSFYEDLKKMKRIKKSLEENNKICIWYGSCLFDRLMMSRLLHFINPSPKNIFVVPLSDYTATTARGKQYVPETLIVLNPEQIIELDPYLRPITPTEIDEAMALWKYTEEANTNMRVLSGTTVEMQEDSYFDSALLANCKNELKKASRVIGETLVDKDFQVSDTILNWRLQELVRQNKLQAKGTLGNMRDYEVKMD